LSTDATNTDGETIMTFGRILGSVFAAAALTVAPAGAALGYGGADEEVVVTDTNPAPGESFEVVVDAGADSPEATLTITSSDPSVPDSVIEIAGTQSMTKATTPAGTATFTVTLYVEDTYTLVGTDADGNVVGESTVVVGDGEPGEPGGDGDGGEEAAGGGGGSNAGAILPATGADTTTTLVGLGGGLLVLGGVVALMLSRRRNAQLG
jgi:LPXTG-motif cell wall-anchored protein